jgi:hypothetical protein
MGKRSKSEQPGLAEGCSVDTWLACFAFPVDLVFSLWDWLLHVLTVATFGIRKMVCWPLNKHMFRCIHLCGVAWTCVSCALNIRCHSLWGTSENVKGMYSGASTDLQSYIGWPSTSGGCSAPDTGASTKITVYNVTGFCCLQIGPATYTRHYTQTK